MARMWQVLLLLLITVWGVIGVAPYAEIVAVKVISEKTGSGAFSWINAGIVYAANNGADVINMSLGATFARNGFYLMRMMSCKRLRLRNYNFSL